jgi:hypothetical protein
VSGTGVLGSKPSNLHMVLTRLSQCRSARVLGGVANQESGLISFTRHVGLLTTFLKAWCDGEGANRAGDAILYWIRYILLRGLLGANRDCPLPQGR